MNYLNPRDMSKEKWLEENATEISREDASFLESQMNGVVCLVDNGSFKAAGIAEDKNDFESFFNEKDSRLKTFWVVNPMHVASETRGLFDFDFDKNEDQKSFMDELKEI